METLKLSGKMKEIKLDSKGEAVYNNKARLKELLETLRTDFEMLGNGSWQPDLDSIQASIDTCEEALKLVEAV